MVKTLINGPQESKNWTKIGLIKLGFRNLDSWKVEVLIMAAKYADEDVFACTKSLYAATKFDDANVGHDPDEDFMKNLGKMRHSKATLKTSQVCISQRRRSR